MADRQDHWVFYFDPNRCIGCHACSISCKQFHGRDSDADDWRTVTHHEKGTHPASEEYDADTSAPIENVPISMSCMHCHDAPCEEVCPTEAIVKRDSDGIVTIDQDKCIGCKYCGWACPFGAPTYGDNGLMSKCNMCLDQGPGSGAGAESKNEQDDPIQPNCVSDCVGGAIKAGPEKEMVKEASQAAAERFKSNNERVIVEPFQGEENLNMVEHAATPDNAGD
ncbi:4Fe-4S dicluster domain-containing protein [Halapricum desulfuricans]|uniref:Fe-S-cluster-containing dehydrogenase component n=1 Tax=Halapricum desulfuricans TaxID=2841257 RepID=A0A897MVC7_9EURY|nr:4Fe-4S dicluster domain-containing protein [Halapricum desulfuricans]QSG04464.1 Fe-S-cluster-containing dehydrogenase component [Halapricum desulfuricans]